MNEFLKIVPPAPLKDDVVELSFDFSINALPDEEMEDKNFPYPDEVFLVNFGETGKFTSDYVYQSRFTVFRAEGGLCFNGYAPDFARKSNVMKNGESSLFQTKTTYSVRLRLTKYRVYINVNDGLSTTSYGNGREEITDVAFYVRNGVDATVSNYSLKGYALPDIPIDKGVKEFIDKGIATNYLFWHVGFDGVYFDRLSVEQNIKCTTRNSGAYFSNVCFDAYTDARSIGIEFKVADQPQPEWSTQFGFIVNGVRQEMPIITTEPDKCYVQTFELPATAPEYNRVTICFPFSVSFAIKRVFYTEGARFAPPEKKGWINFYGDSITEGSECFDPAAVYVSQVCNAYNYNGLDQAVSGRTFNDYNVLGEYYHQPDYVFIANGTNSFCMGTGDKEQTLGYMEEQMLIVINAAKERFPKAKIIALLPIWRSDEAGEKFSLADTSERLREVYARYPEISVIDCHGFVPADADYFSNAELALHPNSRGHNEYGKNLLKALIPIMGQPEERDEPALAKLAIEG